MTLDTPQTPQPNNTKPHSLLTLIWLHMQSTFLRHISNLLMFSLEKTLAARRRNLARLERVSEEKIKHECDTVVKLAADSRHKLPGDTWDIE